MNRLDADGAHCTIVIATHNSNHDVSSSPCRVHCCEKDSRQSAARSSLGRLQQWRQGDGEQC